MGRRAKNAGNVAALEASNPDAEQDSEGVDSSPDSSPRAPDGRSRLDETGSD